MFANRGPFRKTNRSAYLNFLRAKYEMYKGAIDVESYPYYLTLEPADKCQLRCPTCVTGIENETRIKKGQTVVFRSKRARLTTEFMDTLLDELGEYLFLIVFYNFGEPLLNKDLPDLVRKAKAYNIETDINTNLSLPLSDERIEDLLTSGLDYIYVSIDGFSQETYQIHRVGGDLELVKFNLERMVKARDRLGLKTCITYNFLVFSFNEHELPAAEKYSKELGIYFNRRDAFIHNPDWLPSYRKNEKPWILPEKVRLPPEFSYIKDDKHLAWSPLPEPKESKPPRCSWHYGYSCVSAGGQVSPCCAVPDQKNDFGTVQPKRASFADVWNNDLFRRSRADFAGKETSRLDETVCSHCPVSKFVHHMYSLHDFKVIEQFTRTFKDSDPLIERAMNLLCFARYGVPTEALFPDGNFGLPEKFFGTEDENDIARFVEYFEKNLASEIVARRASSGVALKGA